MKFFLFFRILLFIFTFSIYSCDNSRNRKSTGQMISEQVKAQQTINAKGKCTTIQDGIILDADKEIIQPGFNQSGYNYQARSYSGEMFPEASPGWHLNWKWNDAFLSTQDCDGDMLLDIANGQESYRGSGAWSTTKWTKIYTDKEGNQCEVSQITKYIAVPVNATSDGDFFYNAKGDVIGQVVNSPGYEDFANTELIWNDPCKGINGVDYKAPGPVSLGNH